MCSFISHNRDDFWVENAVGRRAYKIDGKALNVRNTLAMQTPAGVDLLQMQGKVASVRNAMDIESPNARGPTLATVKKDLINVVRDEYNVNVHGGFKS